MTAIPPATRSLLEKTAVDNGFDREIPGGGEWVSFVSTQVPLRIWLGADSGNGLVAAVSRRNVAKALGGHGRLFADPRSLPVGAATALSVPDLPSLHRLVRRAFQLSRTLPDELLQTFRRQTAARPASTEAERLVVERVGQDLFRGGLLDYWDGTCAVTGLAVPELLRASHIKPWAACATDAERLDVFNGLLLAPHLDAVFDRGLITVEDDGSVAISSLLDPGARRVLGLDAPLRVRSLEEAHRAYLPWHRERVFLR